MVYASYNRGFKSSSFQPDSFPPQVLQPETVDAFEAGIKTDLFDRRVRFNLSGFYYDYSNLQANQIIRGQLYIYNAPGSINYGLDADLTIRVRAHDMDALLAWRVVAGLGHVCMVVGAVTMIARLTTGRQRTAALALWSTVIPASFIIASLYGVIIGHGAGWRIVFLAHAAGAGMLGLSFAAAFLQTGFVATLPAMLAMLAASIGVAEGQVHSFTTLTMLCNVARAFSFGLLYNRGVHPAVMGLGAVMACALAGSLLVLAPTALVPAMVMNCVLMAGLGVLFGPPAAFAARYALPHGGLVFLSVGVTLSLMAWPIWTRRPVAAPAPGSGLAHG